MGAKKLTKCPECGVSLKGKDNAAHAYAHWGAKNAAAAQAKLSKEGLARYLKLTGGEQ